MKQFVALFALAAALPAASTFPAKTSLDGKKTEKASIILGDGTLRLETKSGQAKEFRLDAIDTLSYSFSKQPRGKAAIGIGILCLPCGIATAFLKKKKHWLSWKAEGEGAVPVAGEAARERNPDARLHPWLTAADIMALGYPPERGLSPEASRKRKQRVLEDLAAFEAEGLIVLEAHPDGRLWRVLPPDTDPE